MSRAFSIIKNGENVLFLCQDGIDKLHLLEYVNKSYIFDKESIKNNIISIIIIDFIDKLNNINLKNYNFANKVTVFMKKNNTIATSFLTIKYLQDELGYKKEISKEKFNKFSVLNFTRPTIKILYLTCKKDENIDKITNHLNIFSTKKKYIFKKVYNLKFNNILERLKLVKKELNETSYLLVIYNYSAILDWTMNLEKLIRINCLYQYAISLDNNQNSIFDNFLVKNNSDTISVIEEIITSICLGNSDLYLENNKNKIYLNNISEIFNITKTYNSEDSKSNPFEFMANFNNLVKTNKFEELDIVLNYYLNINVENNNLLFSSIYLKEYSWGIIDQNVKGAIKFKFRGRLEYLEGNGTYEKITERNYVLNFSNYELHISFYDNFSKFIGFDKNEKFEVIGFLNN